MLRAQDANRIESIDSYEQKRREPSLYHYRSARQFVLDFMATKRRNDRAFSIRRFATQMGLKSHSLLTMILQGKRAITERLVPAFSRAMGLTVAEENFFRALVRLDQAVSEEEVLRAEKWVTDQLHAFGASSTEPHLVTEFWVISHWIHTALLEATALKTFDGTVQSLLERFSSLVDSVEILCAIERLLALKLLKKEIRDGLEYVSRPTIGFTTRNDVPDRAVRSYHAAVSQLAALAVERDPVDEREFQSFAVSVSHDAIPIAKKMIREFRSQLARALASQQGDDVYQVNLQFFKVSQSVGVNRKVLKGKK